MLANWKSVFAKKTEKTLFSCPKPPKMKKRKETKTDLHIAGGGLTLFTLAPVHSQASCEAINP